MHFGHGHGFYKFLNMHLFRSHDLWLYIILFVRFKALRLIYGHLHTAEKQDESVLQKLLPDKLVAKFFTEKLSNNFIATAMPQEFLH